MKNVRFPCLGLVIIVTILFSCNGGSSDNVKQAKDSNAAKIDSQAVKERPTDSSIVLSKPDADFLVDATSGAMMEVELGRIAQANSTTARVQDFGAMMVKDHSAGIEEIKRLASRKKIVLPDSVSNQQQKEIQSLKKKMGGEFDKAYIRMMVSDHESDIKEFEKEAGKGVDSVTRTFASGSLQMLHRHLDSANKLADLLNINKMNVKGEPIPH